MNSGLILTTILALGSTLAAQAIVHPHFAATKEGVSARNRPFGIRSSSTADQTFRYQQIHDRLSTAPVAIKSLTFRRDGAQRPRWEAYKITLELALSTSPKTHKTASITFSENMGLDAKVMVAKKQINFPYSLNTSSLPEPFAFKIPFDSGRSFPLSASRNLCWETKIHGNDLYTACRHDRIFDSVTKSSDGVFAYYGDGCFAPGRSKSFWGFMNFKFDEAKDLFLLMGEGHQGPANGFAFGLVSPNRLVTGLPFGTGGCHFWINPYVFLITGPYNLDVTGHFKLTSPSLTLVNASAHYGFNLYGQWVAVDSKLTNICMSNGIKAQKGFIWGPKDGPDVTSIKGLDTTSITGKIASHSGLVVKFGI